MNTLLTNCRTVNIFQSAGFDPQDGTASGDYRSPGRHVNQLQPAAPVRA
jgi:hypothetical protein